MYRDKKKFSKNLDFLKIYSGCILIFIFNFHYYYYYYYYYLLLESFSHQRYLMVFKRSLSDSKSLFQDSS